ncbi:MAG: hypothetical protein M3177_00575 [Pseudomonadota bacterium]|nr:hypothetical protein [Pseudomonadota bacterium]
MITNAIAAFLVIVGACWTVGYWSYRVARLKREMPQGGRERELLETENAALKRQVGRLEERLAVLERIATDPAERTAREIESLR